MRVCEMLTPCLDSCAVSVDRYFWRFVIRCPSKHFLVCVWVCVYFQVPSTLLIQDVRPHPFTGETGAEGSRGGSDHRVPQTAGPAVERKSQ